MPARSRIGVCVLGAGLLFGPEAAAQQAERCTLEIETAPGTETRALGISGQDYRVHIRGEVEATCGPSRVRADSAVYHESRGELYLYGNVRYRSDDRTLESDRATYFADGEWVLAEGDVRLSDRAGGSTLTGPVVHYYPATESRPLERIFAPRRPHLSIRDASAEADEPFEIDADRVHMYGDSVMAAAGRAVGARTDLTARADSMHMDRSGDRLWLVDDPTVDSRGTALRGDTIVVHLEERRVREIRAWPRASATGEELSLDAPAIRVFIEGDAIERVVAGPGERAESDETGASGDAGRARSESAEYVLEADSLEVLRPGGRLDRVIAVGGARAVSRTVVIPGDSLLGHDWIVGDTITGYFEPVASANGETTPPATDGADPDSVARGPRDPGDAAGASQDRGEPVELARLVARGNARALYHVREEDASRDPERPAMNYVIGRIITIWLEDGAAQEVRVTGPGTGVYLEPLRPGEMPDTTTVDTTVADTAADTAGAGPR